MGKNSYSLRKFQQYTVDAACHHLFEEKGRSVRRYLVADEVGLGKTIIARHVIERLAFKKKGKITVVYITSSLDIAKQNKGKLVGDKDNVSEPFSGSQLVPQDRITLLYSRKLSVHGTDIFSMTPGTSLSSKQGYGNKDERKYLAWLLKKIFHLRGFARLSRIFCGMADEEEFRNKLEEDAKDKNVCKPPRKIVKKLNTIIRGQILISNEEPLLSYLKKGVLTDDANREMIQRVRSIVAKCFLETLKPDLVILDEFQKFSEITKLDDKDCVKHEMSRLLLKPSTPTLLLSATPYRLFSGDEIHNMKSDEISHYRDLESVLGFLKGSGDKGGKIAKRLGQYGHKLKTIGHDEIGAVLQEKRALQKEITAIMARTERVNFMIQKDNCVKEQFMSEKLNGRLITKQNFMEYFSLLGQVSSKRDLFTYWKSGASALSYMKEYELIKKAKLKIKAMEKNQRGLHYTDLAMGEGQHLKVAYIYDDLFKNGEGFNYLWMPPTYPYYPGGGKYADAILKESPIKKGLIFSSWKFVPRQLATEISGKKESVMRPRWKGGQPLDASARNWASFLFPSRFLAEALGHDDYLKAGTTISNLKKIARRNIKKRLKRHGISIRKSASVKLAWKVLRYVDITKGATNWKAMKDDYMRGNGVNELIGTLDKDQKIVAGRLAVHPKALGELVEIALTSPSVCIYRALRTLSPEAADDEQVYRQLLKLGIHGIRSYLNRKSTYQAVMSSYKKGKYAHRLQRYMLDGNFQSVVDEYVYLCDSGRDRETLIRIIKDKFGVVFGSQKANSKVKTRKKIKKGETVYYDAIVTFGGHAESESKDAARESFNSPFWPMGLVTTSVGQEGLDFHLYCKDIYHWNMSSNPVAFEQREGRINRYRSWMIRHNIVEAARKTPLLTENVGHVWDRLFDGIKKHAHRNDRYNLGLSPDWVFTPSDGDSEKYNRHILDMPFTGDKRRYSKLKSDLLHYRLALGQSDQKEFLDAIGNHKFFNDVDSRGLVLSFFPLHFRHKNRREEIEEFLASPDARNRLLADALNYLEDHKEHGAYNELDKAVKQVCAFAEKASRVNMATAKSVLEECVYALYYFIDIHDEFSDREPHEGFKDDLEELNKAIKHAKRHYE